MLADVKRVLIFSYFLIRAPRWQFPTSTFLIEDWNLLQAMLEAGMLPTKIPCFTGGRESIRFSVILVVLWFFTMINSTGLNSKSLLLASHYKRTGGPFNILSSNWLILTMEILEDIFFRLKAVFVYIQKSFSIVTFTHYHCKNFSTHQSCSNCLQATLQLSHM